ncbi:hypothetical protein EBS80_02890 [bacterium]|nr:hypothetical protein [bacterium]
MISKGQFVIHVLPRVAWSWEEFVARTPRNSVALDGMVRGGPRLDVANRRFNFDHHDGVVRDATMSTAMQVYVALKGGITQAFGNETVHLWINDTDQDTSHAVWFLLRNADFEGTKSVPHVSRHLAINDKLDVTGGSWPMKLDRRIVRQHVWVFERYTTLRKTGALAVATEAQLEDNLEANLRRLDLFLMNQGEESEPDIRSDILYRGPRFLMADEIGGSEARWHLFSNGMDAFVNVVARRPDGRLVCSIGRRSSYIPFPVMGLYDDLNDAEGLTRETGWGGSDIVGGSSRLLGTGLPIDEIRRIVLRRLAA